MDFLRVQGVGRKYHTRHFLVFVARQPSPAAPAAAAAGAAAAVGDFGLPPTRLGITVTRKVGNAVLRNRIKRLVRDVFRRNHRRLVRGHDLVWVAKRDAGTVCADDVQLEFDHFVRVSRIGREGVA